MNCFPLNLILFPINLFFIEFKWVPCDGFTLENFSLLQRHILIKWLKQVFRLGWWCSGLIGWFAGSGLMWLVLEPQPGHCVRSLRKDSLAPHCVGSLRKDSLAPHIPPPGVQIGINKRPGKPYNMDKYQISWGKGYFCPLSFFPSLSRNTDRRWRWERTARKFWSCAHKISQKPIEYIRSSSYESLFW